MSRLDRWLSGGLRTVMLPSGEVFRLKVPDVEEMLTKGLIPDDLRTIALKFGSAGVNPETMDTEGLAKLLRFMRALVANSLRYVWEADGRQDVRWQDDEYTGEPWQPIVVAAGMLEEGSIDGDDYAALQGIVSREFSANQITTLSMRDHGMIDAVEADRRIADGKGEKSADWTSFRGERRSAAAGGPGAAMERPPVSANRRTRRARSGSGVPTRRRASPASDGG